MTPVLFTAYGIAETLTPKHLLTQTKRRLYLCREEGDSAAYI